MTPIVLGHDTPDPARQSVSLTLEGAVRAGGARSGADVVQITLGNVTREHLPAVGLGVPAEEIDASLAAIDLLAAAAPKLLVCAFDPREGHGRKQLEGYRVLCEKTGAQCELEVVVESVDGYAAELEQLASLAREAGLVPSAVAVCPAGDLKGVLPGKYRVLAADLFRLGGPDTSQAALKKGEEVEIKEGDRIQKEIRLLPKEDANAKPKQ